LRYADLIRKLKKEKMNKMKFSDLELNERTVKSINNFGYIDVTEVQEKSIPEIISGKNLIVRSQTGSGKTAAFGIGIMERIANQSADKALILVPTRELAVQVCAEIRGISQVQQLKAYAVFGGAPINLQLKDLSKRFEILVATPGRLLDIYNRGKLDMDKFNIVVLDEADHMLDLGFSHDVLSILGKLPKTKQVLLFSATVDGAIKRIASRHMPESEMISIGEMKVVSTIKEEKLEVPFGEKFDKLRSLVKSSKNQKILVFAKTRRCVMKLRKLLLREGIQGIGMLQGDMPQSRRIKVLNMFKNNDISTLIATNVASRGLHIEDVSLIINYDEAETKETHLHRVGRTGRMGKDGKVINFVSPDAPQPRRRNGGGFGSSRHRSGRRPGRGARPTDKSSRRKPRGRSGFSKSRRNHSRKR
jgi:ATP-dependent RNA helicase DeaD